ncbi:hypothetical protein D3C74_172710 [compost metagenome]
MDREEQNINLRKLDAWERAMLSIWLEESEAEYYQPNVDIVFNQEAELKERLKEQGIEDSVELKNYINSLITWGYRGEFDTMCRKLACLTDSAREAFIASTTSDKQELHRLNIVNDYLNRIPLGGISSYDYVVIVCYCRIGNKLDYLTLVEKWDYINQVISLSKKSYTNWKDFIIGFNLGNHYANMDLSVNYISKNQTSHAKLLTSRRSPLQQIDFWHS